MNNEFYFDSSKSIETLYEEYKASDIDDKSIENFVAALPDELLFPSVDDTPTKELPVFSTDEDVIKFLSELPKSALDIIVNRPDVPEVTVEYIERINNTTHLFNINGKNVSLCSSKNYSINETSCGELKYAIMKDAPALFAYGNLREVFKFGATTGLKLLVAAFPSETYLFFMIKSIEHNLSFGKNTFKCFTKAALGSSITFRANKTISNEVVQIYHLHTLIGAHIKDYRKEALAYIGMADE